jgi:hypothetical protein
VARAKSRANGDGDVWARKNGEGRIVGVRGTVRQRTFERYESIVRVHIKPALGRVKLGALTPNHVRRLYRQKPDSGLAPRTVN